MSRLNFALENADIEQPLDGVEGTDLAVAEATVEAQAGAAEVTESAGEVETFDSAVAEASDDAAIVEATAETVAESLEEEGPTAGEGMDQVAATLATETIERIRRKYRIAGGRSTPALESFKPRASRKEMTRLALESIGDTLKNIWQRIKAFFRGLWDRIKTTVKSIFQSNIKTEKRALELKKKLGTLELNTKEKATLESGKFGSAFNIDGKASVATIGTILTNHTALLACVDDINKSADEQSKAVKALMTKLSANITSVDEAALGETIKAAQDLASVFTKQLGSAKVSKAADKGAFADLFTADIDEAASKVEYFGPFFQSKHLFVASMVRKAEKDATGPQPMTVIAEFRSIGKEAGKSIEVGDKAQLEAIVGQVISVSQDVAKAERAVKLGDTAADSMNSAIDASIAFVGTMQDKLGGTSKQLTYSLTYARQLVSSTIKVMTSSNGTVIGNSLSAANTALDYVDASIKAYKK